MAAWLASRGAQCLDTLMSPVGTSRTLEGSDVLSGLAPETEVRGTDLELSACRQSLNKCSGMRSTSEAWLVLARVATARQPSIGQDSCRCNARPSSQPKKLNFSVLPPPEAG